MRPSLAAVAIAAAVLAACASDDESAQPDRPADLTVVALPEFRFDQATYTVASGDRVLGLRNDDQMSHSLIIVDGSGERVGPRLLVAGGRASAEEYRLDPGTYRIICDVPGHAEAGQVADLVVT